MYSKELASRLRVLCQVFGRDAEGSRGLGFLDGDVDTTEPRAIHSHMSDEITGPICDSNIHRLSDFRGLGFPLTSFHFCGDRSMSVDQACSLLLAIAGGEPSHAALVRKHAAADSGFAAAGRIGAAARRNQSGRRKGIVGGCVREMDSKLRKSWLFGSGKGCVAHDRGFGLGTNAKRARAQANGSILVRSREGKMEIPVESPHAKG